MFVAMLRGVNVSGRNRLPMGDFADLVTALGFEDVVTYVQSGNAVFSGQGDSTGVASAIAAALADRLALAVPVIVRTASDLRSLLRANPLLPREPDPTKLHVTFLATDPGPSGLKLEPPAGAGHDSFVVAGPNVYLHCPGGYGRTKLTNDFFERRLGTMATTRNWRTVVTLADMAAGGGANC